MPTKAQKIMMLFDETAVSLSNSENWLSFLKTAAWQYKYSFDDQLLIYAQRPDATACATMEVWNKNMHRWINKGAKGIALLREDGNRYGLEYVFDVSDTNDRYRQEGRTPQAAFGVAKSIEDYDRDVRLWQYESRFDNAIIESLSDSFGELSDSISIYAAVKSAVHNAVEDNKADYVHELKYAKRGSLLTGLDDVNLDFRFRQTAEASISYMIMERIGLNPDDIITIEDFQYIRDFSNEDTIAILGNAVSAISETALREISQTIRAERKSEREKFAQEQNIRYNRNETNIERNDDNGRDSIQDSGRLSDTRSGDTADRGTLGQIRNDEESVSEKSSQEPVHTTDDVGRASQSSIGSRQNSDRTDTENSGADGEIRGSDRNDESERSVEMDRFDEQLSPFSRGDDTAGRGVQLSLLDMTLLTEEEQREYIEKAEQVQRSAFSMPQQVIDEVLTTGGNDRDSVIKICVQYSKNKSAEENINFLKNEYGSPNGKGFQFDNSKISVWWNSDGMCIAYGDAAINRGELLSWEDVDKRIGELLKVGRFAPQETLDGLNEFERKNAARNFYEMYRDSNRDEYPELEELFNKEWFMGAYDDTISRTAELFKKPENVDFAITVAETMNNQYAVNKDIMH